MLCQELHSAQHGQPYAIVSTVSWKSVQIRSNVSKVLVLPGMHSTINHKPLYQQDHGNQFKFDQMLVKF